MGICLAVLAGCASTPPSQSESNAPIRLGVTQQPSVAHRDAQPFYVVCADCPGPTPKTPFSETNKLHTQHPVAMTKPVKNSAVDRAGRATQAVKAETPKPQTKVLFAAHFAFGTAQLSATDKQALQNLLPEFRKQRLTIVGHTDSVGPQDFNDWLALRRAQSVKNHLVTLGLDPERIRVSGRGKCCYLQANDTALGRAANRRAEIRPEPLDTPSKGHSTANQPGGNTP